MPGLLCRIAANLAGPVVAIGVLTGCSESGAPDDAPSNAPEIATVKTAAQALEGAHVPTLDPGTLNDAQIGKVIGTRPRCTFRYTSSGRPVLVAGLKPDGSPELGLIKLNGSLVPLQPGGAATEIAPGGFLLVAEPVRLSVQPQPEAATSALAGGQRVEAEMVFEVGQDLRVGYGGYLDCGPASAAHAASR